MEDTLDDFLQKYKGTFVFANTGKKEDLVLVEKHVDDKYILCYSNSIGAISLAFTKLRETIKSKFPKTGLYNIGSKLFSCVYRVPERQFKRCPTSTNMAIVQIFTNRNQEVNYENVHETFFPYYPKSKTEAKKECNKRFGVALSSDFGITIGTDHEFELYFHDKYIGYIDNDKVNIQYTPLEQEAKDFFGEDLTWK